MILFNPHADKIVVFGQSCSGKTTFAKQLTGHQYYCFDALFPWHSIETFGLSCSESLKIVAESCKTERYVLDGWHLSDKEGLLLPEGASVYVVYCDYNKIISQYRVPVLNHDSHRPMFDRWYRQIDYAKLPNARFFKNEDPFVETTRSEFEYFISS